MPAPVLPPSASGSLNSKTDDTGWKLNQRLLATVVDGDNGRKNLRINGNIYTPLQHLHAETGKTLTLVVRSLSPYVELGLLNRSLTPQRSENQSGILLSQNIRQWPGQGLQAGVPSLSRFMNFLNAPALQPLPPATAALVTALIDRIAAPANLTNPATLKPALLHASLLLGDGSPTAAASAASGNDFRSLLVQLVRSLAGPGGADPGRLLENSGMALYQNVSRIGMGFPLLMARALGEELLQVSMTQQQEQEIIELYERRWAFELPVAFQDRPGSISIRLFEEKARKKQRRTLPGWAAEFEFELPGCGEVKVELKIEELVVSAVITCTNTEAIRQLEENQNALREKLAPFGLLLSGLQCNLPARPEPGKSSTIVSKHPAERENIPLGNFQMQENARALNPADGIPEFLYCGMAALFGYLFDIDEKIR